jgi:hypothetical protein
MECDEALLRIWEYLDRELGRDETNAVDTHLTWCLDCYSVYHWDRALLNRLARLRLCCEAPDALISWVRCLT